MMTPMARSLADGRPIRSALSSITCSASRTEAMSIGKKRMITCRPATRSAATSGHAASVHWPKL